MIRHCSNIAQYGAFNNLRRSRKYVIAVIASVAMAEEQSILIGATNSDVDIWASWNMGPNTLTDGCFKSWLHSDSSNNHGGDKELVIILQKPETIITSYVQNLAVKTSWQWIWATSHIWAGDDTTPMSSSLTKCTAAFHDTGFQKTITSPCKGQRVAIRRSGANPTSYE